MADILPFVPPVADPPADGNRPTVEPLLLSARDLAAMLRLGLRTVRSMDAAGKLPAPMRIGGCVRWKFSEILDWINAGCPSREVWEARRATRS
jgi:predicted DNA-binding transcriptional regulator AlpA